MLFCPYPPPPPGCLDDENPGAGSPYDRGLLVTEVGKFCCKYYWENDSIVILGHVHIFQKVASTIVLFFLHLTRKWYRILLGLESCFS